MESGLHLRRRAVRLLVICACGALLLGCDKCGDWFWISGATPHSCKGVATND